MSTQEIFKKIYQDLKDEMSKNNTDIFLKEYTIPSINYNPNSENREEMYFSSGIEMELNRIIEFFDNKIYFSNYREKYFFSNDKDTVEQKVLEEIKDNYEIELKQKLDEKLEKEYNDFKEEVEHKSPKEIIEKAYELVAKEAIKDDIKDRYFTINGLKALLNKKDVLSRCYTDWEHSDGKLGEIISYTMDDTIKIIEQDYIKEQKKKKQESR